MAPLFLLFHHTQTAEAAHVRLIVPSRRDLLLNIHDCHSPVVLHCRLIEQAAESLHEAAAADEGAKSCWLTHKARVVGIVWLPLG